MICIWTDEETDSNVMGSGAETWEWYETGIGIKDNTYHVDLDDPNGNGTVHATFTRGKIRSIVTEIMMGKHNVSSRIVGYFKNDDPDADAMDVVIQIAAFGEVVYG